MIAEFLYVVSAVLFVLSLKWMSDVKASRKGNLAGIFGMILAVVATVIAVGLHRFELVIIAVVAGGLLGAIMALKMPMTAVPQRTAISHAFGSIAAALVGCAEYLQQVPHVDKFTMAVLSAEVILGFLTFTGSIIAFLKLQEIISGKPVIYPGRRVISLLVFGAAVVLAVMLVINPANTFHFYLMSGLSLLFGILLVLSIGGADMPTVIAILNSFAGLSAVGLGFVLNNKLLIVAGALDGSSGLILAILMCKAMNRSFFNILFGGFGSQKKADGTKGEVQPIDVKDTFRILEAANSVVFVPGYGMAVAQAQHAVHELQAALEKNGADVKYAIHPVAGRMPGHMNVLLAEANVSYDLLVEMDAINPTMNTVDVAIVIGANDVVNPAAKEDKSSPLYGMPTIEVDKARTVIVMKRSMASGFSGAENPLFFKENTRMLFGDAKDMMQQLVAEFKNAKE